MEQTVFLRPEILAPAGNADMLRAAVFAGADAVYLGLDGYNARRSAGNFDPDALREAVCFCHARGVAVHVTLNTLVYAAELGGLADAVRAVAAAGADAVIVDDLATAQLVRSIAPGLRLHGSTQMSIHTAEGAKMLAKLGYSRAILARELSLAEIEAVVKASPIECEVFVHGAMCMSMSGQCMMSAFLGGRSGNRGECAQPCRWKYYLSEETRPGQLYEIGENENGSYILNANDMCTAPFLDLICKAGVDSLKIEGRAKTFYYVASVTAAYRRALDAYLADPLNDNFELPAEVYEELTRTSHRHYSPGFYFGREQARQATDSATYIREWEFVGTVDGWENGVASCQQRGKWSLGDTLEALCPDGRSIPLNPEWIENEAGERVESTPHAMEKYTIPTPELPPMSLLRRKTV